MTELLACPASMMGHIAKIFSGEYDVPVTPPNPVILDLGANIGGFAVWAQTRWPNCKLHCYEPEPGNFEMLKKNVSGAELYQVAVADFDGSGVLYEGASNCGEFSLSCSIGTPQTGKIETVPVTSAIHLPEATILKLDTEGAELAILRSYLYLSSLKAVMLEWHTPELRYRIGELMYDNGFELFSDEAWHRMRGVQRWVK